MIIEPTEATLARARELIQRLQHADRAKWLRSFDLAVARRLFWTKVYAPPYEDLA